jgi:hypothetical protein
LVVCKDGQKWVAGWLSPVNKINQDSTKFQLAAALTGPLIEPKSSSLCQQSAGIPKGRGISPTLFGDATGEKARK